MIMYVFDPRWPGEFRPAATHQTGTRVIWFTIGQNWTIPQIVEQAKSLAGGERTIWLLRLCAHGNSGRMQLGPGLDTGTAHLFGPLRGYFTPDGRGIELHGCSVASATSVQNGGWAPSRSRHLERGSGAIRVPERMTPMNSPQSRVTGSAPARGFAFLKALANATGAPVTAGYDIQLPDPEFRWEGRGTVRVFPDY